MLDMKPYETKIREDFKEVDKGTKIIEYFEE